MSVAASRYTGAAAAHFFYIKAIELQKGRFTITDYKSFSNGIQVVTLANIGLRHSFTMSPTGNTLVSYRSKFESVGINQIHFKVWLTVESIIRVTNPIQSSTITVTREISLIDTVITGEVPSTYLSIDSALNGVEP